MDLELRPVTHDEVAAFVNAVDAAFSNHISPDEHEAETRLFEPERSLACFDSGRIVATAGAYTMEWTLPGRPGRAGPGCPVIPVAGVTLVGVQPTHRRQGLLTRMMRQQLDDVAARGEALALLTASEAAIYGRFGYGPTTFFQAVEVDSSAARLVRRPVGGRMRLVEPDEAAKIMPPVFDVVRRRTPGDIGRSPGVWETIVADTESRRRGWSANWFAVHETEGQVDGFVRYRSKPEWVSGVPSGRLRIMDLVATEPEVSLALWDYLLSIDLMTAVEWGNAPVDLPLRLALADGRRVRVTDGGEFLWARFLDVPAALSARGYAADGRLVLDVADRFRPASGGRFELSVQEGEATCRPSAAPADLVIGTAELASAFAGGARFSTLAAAGLEVAASRATLALADAMFASTPFPWCATGF